MKERIKYEDVLDAIWLLVKYKNQLKEETERINEEIRQAQLIVPDTVLERRVHVSARLFNLIHQFTHGHKHYKFGEGELPITIKDASNISIKQLLKSNRCGTNTLNEFKKLVTGAGLTLNP